MHSSELTPWWAVGSWLTVLLVRLLFRVQVEGLENVPVHGPAILAFNHVSVLDGPVLASEVAQRRRREARFLVAAEVFGKPFFGWVLRTFDQIPIRRGHGDAEALDEAIGTVKAGAIAAIAPEGRVNPDPGAGLLRVRSGVARLALPTGAPVVPAGIWGTQTRWPRGGTRLARPWRPRLAIVFGDPLVAHGDPMKAGDVEAFAERLRVAIGEQVTRARTLAGRR